MKQPLKNLLAFLAGDLGSRALGFLITAYLARVLDTSGFGLINIGFSVLGYLMLIGTPGIHLIEARNAAATARANPERVEAILSLRTVLALVLIAGITLVAYALSLDALARTVIILSCLSLFPLALSLDWFFHGKEQFALMSTAKVLTAVIYGASVFLLARSAEEVLWVPVSFAIGNLAASILFLHRYRMRFGTLRLAFDTKLWRDILSSNVPVGLSVILAQSTVNLPPIVVGWLVSTSDAGLFSAALKVVFVLLVLDRILHALFLPVATRYFSARESEAPRLVLAVLKGALVLLIPLTMCAVLLAPGAISIIFGERYIGAIPILQILLGYFLLTVVNTVFVCSLIGSGRERNYTFGITVGSGIQVVAILVGTLLFGTTGTASGIVVGELITVVIMMRYAHRLLNESPSRALLAPAGAAAVMTAGVLLMHSQYLAVQIGVGLVLFGIAAIVFRVLDKKELEQLRERLV